LLQNTHISWPQNKVSPPFLMNNKIVLLNFVKTSKPQNTHNPHTKLLQNKVFQISMLKWTVYALWKEEEKHENLLCLHAPWKERKKREMKRKNLTPCQKPLHVKFKKWRAQVQFNPNSFEPNLWQKNKFEYPLDLCVKFSCWLEHSNLCFNETHGFNAQSKIFYG
jgi:hypothetical protein